MSQELCVDSATTIPRITLGGKTIELDQYYSFDDAHRIIVRKLSREKLRVEIRRGKTLVQYGTLHVVSPTVGCSWDGIPRLQVASFQLDPKQPIVTGSKAIEALMVAGIKSYDISRLPADGCLRTAGLLQSDPRMLSDGQVAFSDDHVKEGDDLLAASRWFEVAGASWVVVYHEVYISQVYLRSDVDTRVDELMKAVDAVRNDGR